MPPWGVCGVQSPPHSRSEGDREGRRRPEAGPPWFSSPPCASAMCVLPPSPSPSLPRPLPLLAPCTSRRRCLRTLRSAPGRGVGGGRARVPGRPRAPRMSREAGESFRVALGTASPGEASPDCSARPALGRRRADLLPSGRLWPRQLRARPSTSASLGVEGTRPRLGLQQGTAEVWDQRPTA